MLNNVSKVLSENKKESLPCILLPVNNCAVWFVAVSPCVSQTVMKTLADATNNTKTWKHKVAEHEGLLRLIQPGNGSTLSLFVFVIWALALGLRGKN